MDPDAIQVGDWVKTGRIDRYSYEGIVTRIVISALSARVWINNEDGYLQVAYVIEHRMFLCDCGARRPHDDYACKDCKCLA